MRRLSPRTDDGFTLIESLVACIVFMIFASAVLGVVTTTLKVNRTDNARVGASQLASRQLETLRQVFTFGTAADQSAIEGNTWTMAPLPGQVSPTTQVVNGIPYTLQLTVQPLLNGVGQSSCDGGSDVTHPSYLATVRVTWPDMGITAPVTNTTLLTPPKSTTSSPTYGYLTVTVTNAAGLPNSGQTVTVSGPGGTVSSVTDSSGCAVAQFNTAGRYTATLNGVGYVDSSDQASSAKQADVTIGAITALPMTYDKAAEIDVTYTTAAGYALPQTLPQITLANTGIQPAGTLAKPATGTVTQIKSLWPFSTGYAVWGGSCTDADPAAAPTNGSRAPATVVNPGQTGAVSVPLAPVDVMVTAVDGDPAPDVTVTAVKPATSQAGCVAGDMTLTLGTTDVNGHLATSLPDGTWQLQAGTGSSQIAITGSTASVAVAES